MTAENAEIEAFVRRVIRKIHDRYDAMTEKLRRDAQDAQDCQQKTAERR